MKWKNVNDKIPKDGCRVLVAFHAGGFQYIYTQGYILNKEWFCDNRMEGISKLGYIATHWADLPNSPNIRGTNENTISS